MVALSAVSGQVLWRKVMRESVMYIQCGLQYSTQQSPVVILISKSLILAVNGTTGEKTTLRISNYLLVTTFLPVLALSFILKVAFTKLQMLLSCRSEPTRAIRRLLFKPFKTGSNGSPFTPQGKHCGRSCLRTLNPRPCYFQTSRETRSRIC